MAQIRAEERATVWRKHARSNGDDDNLELYPGMMFTLAKERMENTRLWRIAKQMPKGGLLHSHMSAMVDLDFVFNTTLETPGMYFYAEQPLVSEPNRRTASVMFQFSNAPSQQAVASVWSPEYVPNTLIPVKAAAETFPAGGRAGFISWLKDRSSIIEKESIEHHLGVDEVWRKLNSAFMIVASILYYEPILRPFIRRLLESLVEDGVQWVEIREAFTTPYRQENQDTCDDDFNNMVRAIGEEIENFKATEKGKNFWGARIIWTALRGRGADTIFQSKQTAASNS